MTITSSGSDTEDPSGHLRQTGDPHDESNSGTSDPAAAGDDQSCIEASNFCSANTLKLKYHHDYFGGGHGNTDDDDDDDDHSSSTAMTTNTTNAKEKQLLADQSFESVSSSVLMERILELENALHEKEDLSEEEREAFVKTLHSRIRKLTRRGYERVLVDDP